MRDQTYYLYLDSLLQKLNELEAAKRDIEYIVNMDEVNNSTVVNSSSFIRRCYRYAYKMFVIDLCKVLDEREDRNMHSFIRTLQSNYRSVDWIIQPDLKELASIDKRLEEIKATDYYKGLKIARDKYYVHDDKNKEEYPFDVPFEKGWKINTELQEIFGILRYHLKGEDPSFYLILKPYYELESIDKLNKIRAYVIEEYKKERFKEGHISTILDIINGRDNQIK